MVVFFAEEHEFTDDDLELARHLGDAARGALERSELFEAERTARALSQQLARTGGVLATELDPAAVLEEVVQQAPALLGADACAVRTLEDDELVVSAASGEGAEEAVGSRASATARLSGDVFQSRSPLAVEDVTTDERLVGADPFLAGRVCRVSRCAALRSGRHACRRALRLCPQAATVAARGSRCVARARGKHVRSARERRALLARLAGEGTQRCDPREHRRRHRGGRPRRPGRPLELRGGGDQRRASGGGDRPHDSSGPAARSSSPRRPRRRRASA